jgi:DNA-binding XRE family transcriptional regulator
MHAIYVGRSLPSADTTLKIARAFGISVEDLYAEPRDCLAAALPHLYDAPITEPDEGATDLLSGNVRPIKKGGN